MKQNNKGQFLARDWIIATILFSGFIVLFVLAVGSLADEYGVADVVVSEEFSDTFDNFEDTTQNAQEMFEAASSKEGLSLEGTFEVLFSSTFTVISLVFTSVTSVAGQVFGFVEYFGIPSSVGATIGIILLSILSVIIVFIIVSSVSRRDI